jgi:hypothetical protein
MPEPGQISEDTEPIKRFAALTKLQYDRFKAWKGGKFAVIAPTLSNKIEDVRLSDQPRYLTRAHLELTIGDPLYPGIEMWWLAKLPETVGLRHTPLQFINDNNGALFHSTI